MSKKKRKLVAIYDVMKSHVKSLIEDFVEDSRTNANMIHSTDKQEYDLKLLSPEIKGLWKNALHALKSDTDAPIKRSEIKGLASSLSDQVMAGIKNTEIGGDEFVGYDDFETMLNMDWMDDKEFESLGLEEAHFDSDIESEDTEYYDKINKVRASEGDDSDIRESDSFGCTKEALCAIKFFESLPDDHKANIANMILSYLRGADIHPSTDDSYYNHTDLGKELVADNIKIPAESINNFVLMLLSNMVDFVIVKTDEILDGINRILNPYGDPDMTKSIDEILINVNEIMIHDIPKLPKGHHKGVGIQSTTLPKVAGSDDKVTMSTKVLFELRDFIIDRTGRSVLDDVCDIFNMAIDDSDRETAVEAVSRLPVIDKLIRVLNISTLDAVEIFLMICVIPSGSRAHGILSELHLAVS